MEIHHTIAHTKASIEGIPPKNINTDIIWKQIMSRLTTRIHAIQHKTERARIKREAKQEGFSHYNMNKKIEPVVYCNYSKEINENNKLFMRNFCSFNDKEIVMEFKPNHFICQEYKTVNNYQHRDLKNPINTRLFNYFIKL